MNISDWIKNKILKFLGLRELSENPDGERLTYIGDNDTVIKQHLQEYKVWYVGSSPELLNYYLNANTYDNAKEPFYNRTKNNLFWGLSEKECGVERIHSRLPHAIIDTIVNAIGDCGISVQDKEKDKRLKTILDKNNFKFIVNQQEMPMTMVEGWGCFKPVIDSELSDVPLIKYYEAENVKFIYKNGILLGVVFFDYYRGKDGNSYVLTETRSICKEGSKIEYKVFRQNGRDQVEPISNEEYATILPELQGLQDLLIPNIKKVFAIPTKFFYDTLNKDYGLSLYQGKIYLFDFLDMIISQNAQTTKVSTPVEYYSPDLLDRNGKNGSPILPSYFNRQYVKAPSMIPDGDGNTNGNGITTTQPQLNFNQYNENAIAIIEMILIGMLSPATMGIDVAKKDNADAQREKEKVTIMTRENIIYSQEKIVKELCSQLLMLDEYMRTGVITIEDYEISVKYNDFAMPSFENKLSVLGQAWSNGEMSTEKYVDLLWGDSMSEENKRNEILWLDNNKQSDNVSPEMLDGLTNIGVENDKGIEQVNNSEIRK